MTTTPTTPTTRPDAPHSRRPHAPVASGGWVLAAAGTFAAGLALAMRALVGG